MLNQILEQFGLNENNFEIVEFGSGLINKTWKVCGLKNYILQRINRNVFSEPEAIGENLALLEAYFNEAFPDYLFVAPIQTVAGKSLVKSNDGDFFRLFPFIENSLTINEIKHPKEAFEAAYQFGKFTFLLKDFELKKLQYPLLQFHDLKLRFDQFKQACSSARTERLSEANEAIRDIYQHDEILSIYCQLVDLQELPLRVIHHDTKINNVLFDNDMNGLCVIDLDTVMPGYFLSDVGDMLRTYLSSANEEERDLAKIQISEECFYAVYRGYLAAMEPVITKIENKYFIYSGKYMIYMQAIRFLTDFLNDDKYYHTNYAGQNLTRAQNQITLLKEFIKVEDKLQRFIDSTEKRNLKN